MVEAKKNNYTHFLYRPDIDGLRAIAICLVLVFHIFPGFIKSGFIGVDIFFVISGYLVTLSLINDFTNEHLSVFDFYARRINRLIPSILLVLVVSTMFGYGILLAAEFSHFSEHLAGAALFYSNFVLWSESGYFDKDIIRKPLAHFWSLGVEIQFYLIWPLIFVLVCKLRNGLIFITLVISLVSFFVRSTLQKNTPVQVFCFRLQDIGSF